MMIDGHMWHLSCFGGLKALCGERSIERFRTQKTAALLALLALRGEQSREALCASLWPDAAPEAARSSLSTALSALRRDMGDDLLIADRHSVALAPLYFTTDIAAFDAALKRHDWTAATSLYGGQLLAGFHEDPFPALAGEYEEKARGAFAQRLEELERESEAGTRNHDEMRSVARRAILLFGDDEAWFLALMRAHRAAGDPEAALRTYEALQRWARKEGGTASEAARQLAKTLRREKEDSNSVAPEIKPTPAPKPPAGETGAPALPLPTSWTRFFGREAERDVLLSWLANGEKLVTLSGAGGSGKTRLALETVRALASDWSGLVAFVSLAALTDAALLYSTIRDTLQLQVAPDLSPLEQLEQGLSGQRCLLLLDNFEQLGESGALALQGLREKLLDATFLVTSRVVLRLPGEREFPLAPLPTPLQSASIFEVSTFPSAALFCDRAGLLVDEANSGAIGALCRRLDGIPLALELAAARAKVLAPAQILERLERHPDFLQSREFGLPSRHKTLRATIEWSVDLLSPDLRDFFARLAVFRGGWTLEAAEQICSPGICDEWETIDLLESLRDHSLLLVEESPVGTRYRLLEMLREWCESQLDAPLRRELQQRHCAYFLALTESADNPMLLAQKLAEFDTETPNFRVALAWTLEAQQSTSAAELASALYPYWEMRGHFAEGRDWTQRAWQLIERQGAEHSLRARLACAAGIMFWYGGEPAKALEFLQEGLTLHRANGDKCGQALALEFLARGALIAGESEQSRVFGEASLEAARECGNPIRLLGALLSVAWGCHNSGDLTRALQHLSECRQLVDALGERRLAFICDATRTFVLQMMGRAEESAALCDQVLSQLDESAGMWALSFTRAIIGQVSLRLNNITRARTLLPQVTLDFYAVSTRWEVSNMLLACGDLAMLLGDFERALMLYASSDALRTQFRCSIVPCLRPLYEANLARLDDLLDPATREQLWARGYALPLDEAVALTQPLT